MAYLDSAASVTILCKEAAADVAEKQEPNISLGTPSHVPIHTTEKLDLRLRRLPEKAKKAFRVADVLRRS